MLRAISAVAVNIREDFHILGSNIHAEVFVLFQVILRVMREVALSVINEAALFLHIDRAGMVFLWQKISKSFSLFSFVEGSIVVSVSSAHGFFSTSGVLERGSSVSGVRNVDCVVLFSAVEDLAQGSDVSAWVSGAPKGIQAGHVVLHKFMRSSHMVSRDYGNADKVFESHVLGCVRVGNNAVAAASISLIFSCWS